MIGLSSFAVTYDPEMQVEAFLRTEHRMPAVIAGKNPIIRLAIAFKMLPPELILLESADIALPAGFYTDYDAFIHHSSMKSDVCTRYLGVAGESSTRPSFERVIPT